MKEMNYVIRGIAHDNNVAKVAVRDVPDRPGVAYQLFQALADANVNVDMIVQSARISDNTNDIVFTIAQTDLAEATAVLEDLKGKLGYQRVDYQVNVAKVSVVGAGMLGEPGIAAGNAGRTGHCGGRIRRAGTGGCQHHRHRHQRNQHQLPDCAKGRAKGGQRHPRALFCDAGRSITQTIC